MLPLKLTLSNFEGHSYTEIDFTTFSSAVIIGRSKENEDESNGTGKSSILRGINYVVFGEHEQDTLDDLIKDGEDLCQVIFEFEISRAQYQIIRKRHRKTSKSDVLLSEKQGDKWKNIGQRTPSEIEKAIANLIKINFESWKNSVLFSQGDINGLAAAKSPETRRAILKEALNLSEYSKLEKDAKKDYGVVEKKILTTKAVIESLGEPTKDIIIFEGKLIEVKTLLTLSQEKLPSIEEEITQKQISAQSLKEELSKYKSLDQKLVQNQEQKESAQKLVRNIQEKIAANKRNLYNYKSQLSTLQLEKSSLINRKDEINNKLSNSPTLKSLQEELEKLKENEINGKIFISKLETKEQELQNPFPEGDVCSSCRQNVSEEYKHSCLENAQIELTKITEDLEKYKRKLSSLKNKKIETETNARTILNLTNELEQLDIKISHKISSIPLIEENYQAAEKEQEILPVELKTKQDELEKILEEEKRLQEKYNNNSLEKRIVKLEQEIQELNDQKKKIIREQNEIQTQIGSLIEKISQKKIDQDKLNTLTVELSTSDQELRAWQNVIVGYSSAGIPSMIIHTVLDDLQYQANQLLQKLRPRLELQFQVQKEKDGQAKETLDILYRIHGKETNYRKLSGGEKLMVGLSLRLGLSMVIQKKLGIDLQFIALDEVDQPLDKAGVKALPEIINKLSEQFKILVITHNEFFRNKFKTTILVEHEPIVGSKAKVVNN